MIGGSRALLGLSGSRVSPGISRRREGSHTRKTNEETGYVEYIGREPRLVMVHSIPLARLISNDID
jgi:hypothetical protein